MACQAPLPLEFSRQESWSGLLFSTPVCQYSHPKDAWTLATLPQTAHPLGTGLSRSQILGPVGEPKTLGSVGLHWRRVPAAKKGSQEHASPGPHPSSLSVTFRNLGRSPLGLIFSPRACQWEGRGDKPCLLESRLTTDESLGSPSAPTPSGKAAQGWKR